MSSYIPLVYMLAMFGTWFHVQWWTATHEDENIREESDDRDWGSVRIRLTLAWPVYWYCITADWLHYVMSKKK